MSAMTFETSGKMRFNSRSARSSFGGCAGKQDHRAARLAFIQTVEAPLRQLSRLAQLSDNMPLSQPVRLQRA